MTKPIPQATNESQELTDLQIRLTHMEDDIERLNKVITQQDKQLQDMQRQLQLLFVRLNNQAKATNAPFDAANEIPPHY